MSQFSYFQYELTDWHWVLSVVINSQQWLIPLIVQACSLQYKGYLAFLSTYMYFNFKKNWVLFLSDIKLWMKNFPIFKHSLDITTDHFLDHWNFLQKNKPEMIIWANKQFSLLYLWLPILDKPTVKKANSYYSKYML